MLPVNGAEVIRTNCGSGVEGLTILPLHSQMVRLVVGGLYLADRSLVARGDKDDDDNDGDEEGGAGA